MVNKLKDASGTISKSNLGGISSAKIDLYSKKMTAAGWFLGQAIDKVLVYYGENIILGQAKLNQPRPDVYKKYPRFKNPNPGYIFEAVMPVDFCENMPIIVKIFDKNGLVCTYQTKLEPDAVIKNELEKILKNNKVYFNYTPGHNVEVVLNRFNELNVEVKEVEVDFNDYEQWMNRVDYETNFPGYVKEFSVGRLLNSKSLQHYLSIKLLAVHKKDKCLDVASSASVFPDILTKYYKVKRSYRHDWLYKEGVHGLRIGSNAEAVPLPDGSIDKISLHCSWEHFENDADIKFIKETHRLLKENGKLCIIPLYMAEEYFALTSPGIWPDKYAQITKEPPQFEKGMIVCINDEFKQRQAKYYDPKYLFEKVLHPFEVMFDFEIIYFVNHKDYNGCPVFALNAARK